MTNLGKRICRVFVISAFPVYRNAKNATLAFPVSLSLGNWCCKCSARHYVIVPHVTRSRDSVVDISSGYGLVERGFGVRVPVGTRIFSSPRCPGFGAHPTSYPMGTGGKAAGAWSCPLTSSLCWRQENVDLYIHSPIRLHGVVLN
jgi:hypothetical protein